MRRRTFWLVSLLLLMAVGALAWFGTDDSSIMASSNRIGVVEVRGTIDDSQDNVREIKEFRKDENVRAILVRIDSPGGAIGPSQEVYREIRRTITEKPVVASMGAIAASGGYYIASAANRIVANPGTITGSIGVIIMYPKVRELLDTIGLDVEVIKSGRLKDVGNPARDMSPEERQYIQGTVDEGHRQFIRDVALGRGLEEEKVREIADGRIMMGQTARELGLVDDLGNFEDAVETAARLGKIEGEPEVVFARKKKRSLLDYFLDAEVSSLLRSTLDGSMSFLRYEMPMFR